ncbi:MAG: hypothetical protein ABW328_16525 [Ilumatobacteraceae bacterium]
MLARTMIGFAAPVPPGVDTAAKLARNTTCLVVVVLLGAGLRRAIATPAHPTSTSG